MSWSIENAVPFFMKERASSSAANNIRLGALQKAKVVAKIMHSTTQMEQTPFLPQ